MLIAWILAAGSAAMAAPPATTALTPELPVSVYKERRERVMKELGGCMAVIAAQGAVSGVTDQSLGFGRRRHWSTW